MLCTVWCRERGNICERRFTCHFRLSVYLSPPGRRPVLQAVPVSVPHGGWVDETERDHICQPVVAWIKTRIAVSLKLLCLFVHTWMSVLKGRKQHYDYYKLWLYWCLVGSGWGLHIVSQSHCVPGLLCPRPSVSLSHCVPGQYVPVLLCPSPVIYYYYWSLLYSPILRSGAYTLCSHVILHEWIALHSVFLNIHWSGVLRALAWLVPHETAAISACSVYTIQPCTMSLHAKPHA